MVKELSLAVMKDLGSWRYPVDYDTACVSGVAVDSRLVTAGQLFVALSGAKVDGHSFLGDAASCGAIAAIVHSSYRGPDYGMALLAVDDTLKALQRLAANELARQCCRVIAITGSVGKTTTKEFLHTLLTGSYKVAATPGNANSQIGLPLALLNGLNGDEDIVICEMGMSRGGEISRLLAIAPPYLSIINNVALAHAANFISLAAIAHAKGEILAHPATALALVNRAIDNYDEICSVGMCRKYSFGNSPSADYIFHTAVDGSLHIEHQCAPLVTFPALKQPGNHNGENFLVAALAAHICGVSWEAIAARQCLLKLPERRLQHFEKKGVLFVNDAYNACLASVSAAFQALPMPKEGCRRIAAIGAMLELGDFSDSCHRALGEEALEHIDLLFCLGVECSPAEKVWRDAGRPCLLFEDREDLTDALRATMVPGDVVLVKGSRAKEMWKVIEEV